MTDDAARTGGQWREPRNRATMPPTQGAPDGAPLLRHGDGGDAVRDVQQRLRRALGIDALDEEGFGPLTLDAVRRFQRDRGLAADGIVGRDTMRALEEARFALGDRLLWQTTEWLRGDDVRDLQNRLNRLGFDAGPEDGIFGPALTSALEEFQRNVGLRPDGVAGPHSVEALRRLHRGHQSGGLAVRARQRLALRQLAGRGIVGARVLVDPSRGGGDPGVVGPGGTAEADLTWALAQRLVGRLIGRGATAHLSRGPLTSPTPSERARLANELDVDVVLSLGVNSHRLAVARGAATYYFGAPAFTSESGRALAEHVQDAVVAAGWTPDCRMHPMTWPILRETRMATVVLEPGFLTAPSDERRLASPARQEALAAALVDAVADFLGPLPAAGAGGTHAVRQRAG